MQRLGDFSNLKKSRSFSSSHLYPMCIKTVRIEGLFWELFLEKSRRKWQDAYKSLIHQKNTMKCKE